MYIYIYIYVSASSSMKSFVKKTVSFMYGFPFREFIKFSHFIISAAIDRQMFNKLVQILVTKLDLSGDIWNGFF